MWQPSVQETYGNRTTSYVDQVSKKFTWNKHLALFISTPDRWDWSTQTLWNMGSLSHHSPRLSLIRMTTKQAFQGLDSYNAYEKDLAVVNIFFGGSTAFGKIESQSLIFWRNCSTIPFDRHYWYDWYVPEFERSPKMTWLDFISGLGGICGLCLGISFVSLVEIIYWFSVRLFRTFWSANSSQVKAPQRVQL